MTIMTDTPAAIDDDYFTIPAGLGIPKFLDRTIGLSRAQIDELRDQAIGNAVGRRPARRVE